MSCVCEDVIMPFHINLFYSYGDGRMDRDIHDLAMCSAFGNTPEEALREALIAKETWLEAARELGKPIPEPRYRPVTYQTA